MNLNQLKLFYLAVKYENLSRAAAELNITQPAVTKGIQRLQEQYEVVLVERLGRRPKLTEAGRQVYELAARIFELEKLVDDCLARHSPHGHRQLNIHASETIGAYCLPPLISCFSRRHSEIRIKLEVMPNDQVWENTLNLSNDMGFISTPMNHPKIVTREILKDELIFILSPGHPLSTQNVLHLQDLENQTLIMHEEGSYLQQIIEKLLAREKIAVNVPATYSNNEAIKGAVAAGAGIAPISSRVAQKEIDAGHLVARTLADHPLHRPFFLIRHKSRPLPPILDELMELIAAARP